MRFVFDLDGTLCARKHGKVGYESSYPFPDMVEYVNELYDDGHYIIICTARGVGTNNGVVAKAYNQWYTVTERQLQDWGVKYHELHLGKPWGDVYVDDKALKVNEDGVGSLDILKKFVMECTKDRKHKNAKKRTKV